MTRQKEVSRFGTFTHAPPCCSLYRVVYDELAVWQDWVIFETSFEAKFLQKQPKYLPSNNFGLLLKRHFLHITGTIEQLLERIGLLFTPASGHTDSC